MAVKRVIHGFLVVPMGMANAFLIEGDDGLTLIDAGYPAKKAAVFRGDPRIRPFAGPTQAPDFYPGHPDHIGSACAIVQKPRARTYMHPLDIPLAGEWGVRWAPCGGHLWAVATGDCASCSSRPDEQMQPVAIDRPLTAGEILPVAGGIEVIHAPGHCAGQVALLWRSGRMLFARAEHERHGPRRSRRLRGSERRSSEPAQTCRSFIRCRRVRPLARRSPAMRRGGFRDKWGGKSAA